MRYEPYIFSTFFAASLLPFRSLLSLFCRIQKFHGNPPENAQIPPASLPPVSFSNRISAWLPLSFLCTSHPTGRIFSVPHKAHDKSRAFRKKKVRLLSQSAGSNKLKDPCAARHQKADHHADPRRDGEGEQRPLHTFGLLPDGHTGSGTGPVHQGKQHRAHCGQPGPTVSDQQLMQRPQIVQFQ